ncbi:MAG TPA: hypothetical protein VEE82_02515 [Thermodesulfovibrionales bacterium]|nr:hypothetical protein [Thermodesulfovibrionales bacterium]
MTVKNLMDLLEKYPPNMKAVTYNETGRIVEVAHAEVLPGEDEVWHEKQGDDVLLIS